MNQAQNITLRRHTFAVDISQTTEWNYMVVGGDGSIIFVKVDESTGMPTRAFLKPDKDFGKGFNVFFKENGLLDKIVVDDHILHFDNFRGYKYDLIVIYPDNTMEYLFDIETNVNWDDYISASILAKAHIIRNIFDNPFWYHGVGIASCAGTIVTKGSIKIINNECGGYITDVAIDIARFVIDKVLDGFTAELAHLFLDLIDCKDFFGEPWEDMVDLVDGIGGANSCVSAITNAITIMSDEDLIAIAERYEELCGPREQFNQCIPYREFLDPRDNRIYRTVKIGSQTWMAENLDYVDPSWTHNDFTGNLSVRVNGSWCYGNNSANCDRYGRLYTWDAAVEACPAGWRLPDDGDWRALIATTAVGSGVQKLLSRSTRDGTDDFGFSALLGGYRNAGVLSWFEGGEGEENYGNWWSATENDIGTAHSLGINFSVYELRRIRSKPSGLSVRCVQDNDYPPASEWMNRNLNVETPDSWCYNDDPANCETYGRLYTWEAAMSACSILGDGWRLPTRTDWNALVNKAGGYLVAGGKLKATAGWAVNPFGDPVANGTDDFGFSALPGGSRSSRNGSFSGGSMWGWWWSTREYDGTNAHPWRISSAGSDMEAIWNLKDNAFSVRCVR
jgi:uncharacterized protein (TIGR02145 family)